MFRYTTMSEIHTIPIIKMHKNCWERLYTSRILRFLLGFGDILRLLLKKGIYRQSLHPIYTLKRPQIETRCAPGHPATIPRAEPQFWLMMFAKLCSLPSAMQNLSVPVGCGFYCLPLVGFALRIAQDGIWLGPFKSLIFTLFMVYI